MRSPRASVAPANSSPPSMPTSVLTCFAWVRASLAVTSRSPPHFRLRRSSTPFLVSHKTFAPSTMATRIPEIRARLVERFERHPHVADIRQWGMMAGIELVEDRSRRLPYSCSKMVGARAARAARRAGVLIRPLGDVIVFMPPLSITDSEINLLLDAALNGINEVTGR